MWLCCAFKIHAQILIFAAAGVATYVVENWISFPFDPYSGGKWGIFLAIENAQDVRPE